MLPRHEAICAHGRSGRLALGVLRRGSVAAQVDLPHSEALGRPEYGPNVESRPQVVQHQDQGHPRPAVLALGAHCAALLGVRRCSRTAGGGEGRRRCRGSGRAAGHRQVVGPRNEELVVAQATGVLPLDGQGHRQKMPQVHIQGLHLLSEARKRSAILVFVPAQGQQAIPKHLQQGQAKHTVLRVPDALDALRQPHQPPQASHSVLAHALEGLGLGGRLGSSRFLRC
mmetsp:Transcript_22863/g.77885  ORF Transcript_22863/g.77885 Transcript_22863/m.77885 type:complete len:227 (+) Transcript_22863:360-1040(+)